MGLILILAFQLIVTVVGFALIWRRLDAMSADIARLRGALDGRGAAPVRAAAAQARAARARRMTRAPRTQAAREAGRGMALAALATAPAIAFSLNAAPSTAVAAGLAVGAAMLLAALNPAWRAAAWAGVLTASAWALIGLALATAHASPVLYSVAVGLAGASGLLHAYLRRALPGAAMALAMGAALIALGSQTGMIGPAGAVFGALVGLAAVVGAASLRLETVHLAAFGATLIGLFVLSGQSAAAIWFTPVTAWAGAGFLAIAMVRAPQLGARGAAIAGTGALAPLAAIAALHGAQHGLADRFAAAGAFFALALILAGVLALAALRRERGLEALKLTLWVLAAGAFTAAAIAIALALSAPWAGPAHMALALSLVVLNMRTPHAAWRALACAAGAAAVFDGAISAALVLTEAPHWTPWALIVLGFVLPAIAAGAAAALANKYPVTKGFLELAAIALGVAGANLAVRGLFSGGATLLQPIGLVEAGVHISVWLAAALVIAAPGQPGTQSVRGAAASLLGLAALAVSARALCYTPYWSSSAGDRIGAEEALGFALPALLFGAHFVFWRARGSNLRTRLGLGAGALMAAGALTFFVIETRGAGVDSVSALVGASALTLAIAVNFAPGLAGAGAPSRRAETDLLSAQRRVRRA